MGVLVSVFTHSLYLRDPSPQHRLPELGHCVSGVQHKGKKTLDDLEQEQESQGEALKGT